MNRRCRDAGAASACPSRPGRRRAVRKGRKAPGPDGEGRTLSRDDQSRRIHPMRLKRERRHQCLEPLHVGKRCCAAGEAEAAAQAASPGALALSSPAGPSSLLARALLQTRVACILRTMTTSIDEAIVQMKAIAELCNIADEGDANQEVMVSLSCLETVVRSMTVHYDAVDVLLLASSLLHKLLSCKLDRCKKFAALRGFDVVVASMVAHESESSLQKACFQILRSAIACNEDCLKSIDASGAINVVVDAMLKHSTSEDLQEAGLQIVKGALPSFLARSEDPNSFSIKRCLWAVMRAIQTHTTKPILQRMGFNLLVEMVADNTARCEAIASHGGTTIILDAMKYQLSSLDVLTSGSQLCLALCKHLRSTRAVLVANGGVQVVLEMMEQFRAERHVQKLCCQLLRQLAKDVACLDDKSVLAACVQSVLRAMEKHPTASAVQKASLNTLRYLVAKDINGLVMPMCLGRCGRLGYTTTMRSLSLASKCSNSSSSVSSVSRIAPFLSKATLLKSRCA
eukprot:TRINITY_DN26552_c0_g3_i1.p1 TRINITY_DN26552_c0_g3~~TRINITY_DN26552_c0_g3_i1.p1  ORF type:complete len:532 (+),score=68.12 TRINITY_DN26552_c0_g3_i1:60-1598(+)